MPTLAAVVLAISLVACGGDLGADDGRVNSKTVTPAERVAAWQMAWRHVPEEYRPLSREWSRAASAVEVTIVDEVLEIGGQRFYFRHYKPEPAMGDRGKLEVFEAVDLYLRPHERCAATFVLAHAYLGTIWYRLYLSDPAFAEQNGDIREWVLGLWPLPTEIPECV